MLLSLLAAWATVCACSAFQHTPLSGTPQQLSLQHVKQVGGKAGAAAIFAASGNVLSSVDPTHGGITWRQALPEVVESFEAGDEIILARQISTISVFTSASGFLAWDWSAKETIKGSSIQKSRIYAWTERQLFGLNRENGAVEWTTDVSDVYAVTLSGVVVVTPPDSISFQEIHLSDGQISAASTSLGSVSAKEDTVAFPTLDRFVWLSDSNTIKSFCANSKSKSPKSYKTSNVQHVISVGLDSEGYFLAKHTDGSASILNVLSETCEIKSSWEFKEPTPDAVYTSSIDRESSVHVARLTYSESMQLAMLSIYSNASSPLNIAGTGYVQGSTFPYKQRVDGKIIAGVTEVAAPDASADEKRRATTVHRSLWLSTSGSMQMWYAGSNVASWTSEQGLSGITKVAWIDDSTAQAAAVMSGREGIVARNIRHISELASFFASTQWKSILNIDKVIGRLQSMVSIPIAPKATDESWLTKSFGIRKTAVAASEGGKIFNIDIMAASSLHSDRIIWQTLVSGNLQIIEWKHLWVAQVGESKRVLAIGVTGEKTMLYQLDATTGRLLSTKCLAQKAIMTSFLLPAMGADTLSFTLVDSDHTVSTFSVDESQSPTLPAQPLYYWTQPSLKSLSGYQVTLSAEKSSPSFPNWVWSLAKETDERIVSVVPQKLDNVASVGRIMGNRTTLYKMLNPHLLAVTTASQSTNTLTINLVDSVSGNVVFRATHANVDSPSNSVAHLTENWLVYTYRDNGLGKRSRIVSVELFEGKDVPKKVKGQPRPIRRQKIQSSFEKSVEPIVYSQTFLLPYGVSSMSTTTTRFGVTRKALIVTTDQNAIVTIPRRQLDPRRPQSKPTNYDAEEQLIPYEPSIPNEPKWVLSQGKQFLSGKSVISTTPTLLESTSLLLVAGMDLFSTTELAPSGTFDVLSEDFNKIQLGLVLGGLLAGILIVKPIVANKRLKAKWYSVQ